MTTQSVYNASEQEDLNYNTSTFLSPIQLSSSTSTSSSSSSSSPSVSQSIINYITNGFINNLTSIGSDEIITQCVHRINSTVIGDNQNDNENMIIGGITTGNIGGGGVNVSDNGIVPAGLSGFDIINNSLNSMANNIIIESINCNNLTNIQTNQTFINSSITITTTIGGTSSNSNSGGGGGSSSSVSSTSGMGNLQISLYAIIFMLAIVGNLLVILTLVQNRRMRTITNLFLLNLAISDILLGVLCMPPTLVGSLLRDFIFGRFMCKILPYLQACSVSVSAWTLVAISCERYYAICHPLRSRTWQTLKHAYKLIALIWIGSLFLMSPIAYLSKLIPLAKGGHKCREEWPESWKQPYEKIFNIYLDIILLIIPVLVLTGTYTLISRTLWHGMRAEKAPNGTQSNNLMEVFINKNGSPSNRSFVSYRTASKDNINLVGNLHQYNGNNSYMQNSMLIKEFSYSTRRKHGLRRTNIEKSLQNKKRVIKMLFMVVLEFFICWTPLYVVNTFALFNSELIYSSIGYAGISFFQLLAYSSSCCNPITYCFMNRGFRKAFLNLFRCFKRFRSPKRKISIGGGGTQETDLEISRLQCQRLCTDSTISY